MTVRELLTKENQRLQSVVNELLKDPGDCVALEAAVMDGAECAIALSLLPDEKTLRGLMRVYVNDNVRKALNK